MFKIGQAAALGLDCLAALRFRKRDVLEKLPLSEPGSLGTAVGQLTAITASIVTLIEIASFLLTGSTLPVPTLFVELGVELVGFFFVLLLAPFGVFYLKYKGQVLAWRPALACSFYVSTSTIAIAFLFFVIRTQMDSSETPSHLWTTTVSSLARNLIWLDSAILFFWILQERKLIHGIHNSQAGCLFYLFVGLVLGLPLALILYILE